MWRRLRRRSLAPRRPIAFGRQAGLVLLTGVVLVGSIALVLYVVLGG